MSRIVAGKAAITADIARCGAILGGGAKGFAKYEKPGDRGVTLAMSNLLRLLEAHPRLLRELPRYAAAAGAAGAKAPARKRAG